MKNKVLFLGLALCSCLFAWSASYNVTISTSNSEAGYVTITIPKGDVDGTKSFNTDDEGSSVSFTVASGRVINLTPTVNDKDLYYFKGWSDGNTDNPRSITVKKNLTLTANFVAYPVYTTKVKTSSASQGSVFVECLTNCVDGEEDWASVKEGGKVRIAANAEEGFRFVRWDDDGADNTSDYRTIIPTEDKTYTAIFNINDEGTCGTNLTWKVNTKDSVLTISGTGKMAEYDSFEETPWYELGSYIKTVVIEEGVTQLSENAFPDGGYVSYKSYRIPKIVHNYSPLIIRGGSGDENNVFYIYFAQEIHNYYTHKGTCGDGISWSYTDGVLTVSGEGELNYTVYSSTPWHNYIIDTVVVKVDNIYATKNLFPTSAQIIIGEDVKRITIGVGFDKVTAMSDETVISIISNLQPFDATQYYDVDGDGEMEMMQIVSNWTKGNSYLCDVHVYDTRTGVLVSDKTYPVSAYSSRFTMLNYLNANNDGKPDMVYYYQTASGEPYKLELIESSDDGYVAKPIDALYSQEKRLPFFPLDADLDGHMDFYSCEGDYWHFIHYRQLDGSYMKVPLQIITDTAILDDATKQWMNTDAYLKGSYLFEITQGGYSMVGEIVKGPFQYMDTPIDINNDGLVDLLSSTKGALLLNIGNNRFIPSQAPGRVIPKDLNGDGILDYVLFDDETNTISIKIYTENGIVTKTLMQNANINHVWCYDFDKDGDMDILLPFDWNESSGYAYLVFFRNDGNNTFKKIENAFDEPIRHFYFYDCKDVDNDGKYEILALDSVANSKLYKGNGYIIRYDSKFHVSVDNTMMFANTLGAKSADLEYYNLPLIADFNNDGKLDYWYAFDGHSTLAHFSTAAINKAPQKMGKPNAAFDSGKRMLEVMWNSGNDSESPSLDLTYNLRIGTQPGKGDVWYAMANADGKQRDILGGNVGGNISQRVNAAAWEVGKYYIAVQAVDPNGLGGAWSDELVYHHTAIPSQFETSDYALTTADTLQVHLSTAVNKDYTFNWNFGDNAVIIDQEGQNYLIAYKSSGNKIISLQVKSSEGVSSVTTTREVLIYPVRFEYSDKFSTTASRSYCDLNMDGYLDAFESRPKGPTGQLYSGGFYRGKDDGSFVKLAKTYNSDLSPYGTAEMCFIDYNMDGLPDVLHSSNKGNLFINEEEFDMSLETHEFKRNYYYGYNLRLDDLDPFYRSYGAQTGKSSMYDLIDYDRDGYLDGFFWGNNLHIYDTDTLDTWKQIQLPYDNPEWSNDNKYFADLNGDGLADVLVAADISEDHIVESTDDHDYRRWFGYNIYLQQTDGSIRKLNHITIGDETATIEDIADLNNDGYVDLIVIKNYKTIAIYLGDKDLLFKESVNITLSGERKITTRKSISAKRDLDNNGYPDLVSSDGFVIYIYPDFDFLCQSIPTNYTYPFIDLNGDGVPDFDDYNLRSRITNEAPAIPQNLHMLEENGAVKLMWDAAIDCETPAVQMRYNISIKKKNAQVGNEHAFIISPMNGLSDEAAVVPDYPYYRGTQTFIPYKRFELGQEYECQIQSIDAWNEHSPMSAPITFTVQKNTTYDPDNNIMDVPAAQSEIVLPCKIMRNGNIYILRSDHIYTPTGQEVK